MNIRQHMRHSLPQLLAIGIIITLLMSFGLHAVQVPHDHQSAASYGNSHDSQNGDLQSLNSYLHAAEKKFWLIATGLMLMSTVLVLSLYGSWTRYLNFVRWRSQSVLQMYTVATSLLYNYLQYYFRQGLLHARPH